MKKVMKKINKLSFFRQLKKPSLNPYYIESAISVKNVGKYCLFSIQSNGVKYSFFIKQRKVIPLWITPARLNM